MKLKFLTTRDFQVDEIVAEIKPVSNEGFIEISPIPATRRQETVLCGHLIVVTDDGQRANYDVRLRAADGRVFVKPVSGIIPPRRAKMLAKAEAAKVGEAATPQATTPP